MSSVRGSGARDAENVGDTGSEAIAADESGQASAAPHHSTSGNESSRSASDGVIPRPVFPPECPLLVRSKATIQTGGATDKAGNYMVMLQIAYPPLIPGGHEYAHALAKGMFWKALGPAVLAGQVRIVPDGAIAGEASAINHCNNALQILNAALEELAGIYCAADVGARVAYDIADVSSALAAVARRLRCAVNDLTPGATRGAIEPALLDGKGVDERQLLLLDGGQQ